MALSDAEKQRIYEEEKARIEARERIKNEAKDLKRARAKVKARERKRKLRIPAVIGILGMAIVLIIAIRTKDTSTTSESPAGEKDFIYMYVNASTLNIRSGPGEEFDVIEILTEGEQVPVYEIRGDWAKVRNDPVPGYVFKAFLGRIERADIRQ